MFCKHNVKRLVLICKNCVQPYNVLLIKYLIKNLIKKLGLFAKLSFSDFMSDKQGGNTCFCWQYVLSVLKLKYPSNKYILSRYFFVSDFQKDLFVVSLGRCGERCHNILKYNLRYNEHINSRCLSFRNATSTYMIPGGVGGA